jgi:hypothetical protein
VDKARSMAGREADLTGLAIPVEIEGMRGLPDCQWQEMASRWWGQKRGQGCSVRGKNDWREEPEKLGGWCKRGR